MWFSGKGLGAFWCQSSGRVLIVDNDSHHLRVVHLGIADGSDRRVVLAVIKEVANDWGCCRALAVWRSLAHLAGDSINVKKSAESAGRPTRDNHLGGFREAQVLKGILQRGVEIAKALVVQKFALVWHRFGTVA